jgi:hypothetical protein
MILHVLINAVRAAFQEIKEDSDHEVQLTQITIPSQIGKAAALQAKTVFNHVIDIKFAMMPPEEKLPEHTESNTCTGTTQEHSSSAPPQENYNTYFNKNNITEQYGKYIKKVLLFKGSTLKATGVRTPYNDRSEALCNSTNRYPTAAAESFLNNLQTVGLLVK